MDLDLGAWRTERWTLVPSFVDSAREVFRSQSLNTTQTVVVCKIVAVLVVEIDLQFNGPRFGVRSSGRCSHGLATDGAVANDSVWFRLSPFLGGLCGDTDR